MEFRLQYLTNLCSYEEICFCFFPFVFGISEWGLSTVCGGDRKQGHVTCSELTHPPGSHRYVKVHTARSRLQKGLKNQARIIHLHHLCSISKQKNTREKPQGQVVDYNRPLHINETTILMW